MNEQPIKRTNKGIIALIITIVVIIMLVPVIIAVIGLIFLPKMINSLEEKIGNTNYQAEGLKIYIPSNWKQQGDYQVSPSGNCKIIGGTTLFEQDRVERMIVEDELEHKIITINDIEMSYGYKEDGIEKIYSYHFKDYTNKYFIIFRNKVESDEECNSYLEKLENSITLDFKGDEL